LLVVMKLVVVEDHCNIMFVYFTSPMIES